MVDTTIHIASHSRTVEDGATSFESGGSIVEDKEDVNKIGTTVSQTTYGQGNCRRTGYART